MGFPKLLLPWAGSTVIDRVLSAWRSSVTQQIAIVVRPGDKELQQHCRQAGVDVVVPAMDPAQMKDSVKLGLEWARSQYDPHPTDVWLLAPADMPRLTPALIDRVLAAYDPRHPTICLPVHLSGRRGHPALFPWSLAHEVEELGEGESIKQIIQRHPVRSVASEGTGPFEDMDTPEDYAQMQERT